MYRLGLRSIHPKQLGSIIIVIIAIKSLGALARQCRSDEYFDPNTQNCDSCRDVCAVGDCSRECPNYTTSSPSTTAANATTTATTTTTTANVFLGISLGTFIIIIICAVGFLSVVALFVIIAYKKYFRKKRNVFQQKVTINPIEETEQGINSEIVPLNIVVDV